MSEPHSGNGTSGTDRREPGLLFLADADVRQLLTTADAVRICHEMLVAQAAGRVVWGVPRLLAMGTPTFPTRYMVKGCILPDQGVAGMRVISKHPERSVAGEGTKYILLGDAEVGLWRAIMDEETAHKLRTGAAVAAAAQLLVRPGAQVLALVGAGPMARTSLAALAAVFTFADVRVASRTLSSRRELATWAREELSVPARPVDGVEAAVRGADLVITATSAPAPIIPLDWLAPGACAYAMGDDQELADDVYAGVERFVADDWEQVQVRADIQKHVQSGVLGPDRVVSLWEVAGGLQEGRRRDGDRILVRSQGLVTQDIAIAWWVYRQALERGLGTVLG